MGPVRAAAQRGENRRDGRDKEGLKREDRGEGKEDAAKPVPCFLTGRTNTRGRRRRNQTFKALGGGGLEGAARLEGRDRIKAKKKATKIEI